MEYMIPMKRSKNTLTRRSDCGLQKRKEFIGWQRPRMRKSNTFMLLKTGKAERKHK